jgi:hypothetical protein
MGAALDADRAAHGIYAWWLTDDDALPEVPATPHPSEPVGLLYVGVGPGRTGSARNLRQRFGDHTTDTGRSTLRRALAAFLYERKGWHPYWTTRTVMAHTDESALTAWLTSHLQVQWLALAEPWTIEPEVVHLMRPPLNYEHNKAHPFFSELDRARKQFRATARAAGPRP